MTILIFIQLIQSEFLIFDIFMKTFFTQSYVIILIVKNHIYEYT